MSEKNKVPTYGYDVDQFYIDDIAVRSVTVNRSPFPDSPLEVFVNGRDGYFHVATIDLSAKHIGCCYHSARLVIPSPVQRLRESCGICKLAHDTSRCPQLYDLLEHYTHQIDALEDKIRRLEGRLEKKEGF